MSDTPKFTVVDRRKFRAEDDSTPTTESSSPVQPPKETAEEALGRSPAAPASAPRLTLVEPIQQAAPKPEPVAVAVAEEPEDLAQSDESHLPPAPSPEESRFQKTSYDQASERLDDLIRAQNPGAPPQEKIGFEHLVQQLYLSAMMQMGAGTPEGQRPRIDILGARQTIDLLGVVLDKSQGNLSPEEARTLDTVLYELRMTFLELTRMISAQPPLPPPPGGGKSGAKR
jgi:hypothetical protein